MNNLIVIKHNNINVVDSREVAEMVGKRHSDLLESIKVYVQYLTNGNFRSLDFFIPSTYEDSKGEERPCYLLTRKGCDMVANKMTGEKGVFFTATYVTKFEEMEKQVLAPQFKLSKELQALVRKVGTRVLGGYRSQAYKDNSLRGKVYSDIQHQLKREFGIERYEAIKRSQLDTARKIVSEYKVPTVLFNEIFNANSQLIM